VQPLPRIGPFQERLDTLLTENEARPRRERLRMTRIHDLLLREGFDGSYDAVRRYAKRWLDDRRKDAGDGAAAFIPLMFRPGEAYQFDWSHEDVEIAGKPMRVKVAHMLCASRAVFVRAYPRHVDAVSPSLAVAHRAQLATEGVARDGECGFVPDPLPELQAASAPRRVPQGSAQPRPSRKLGALIIVQDRGSPRSFVSCQSVSLGCS
jgi:hypothetical protein